MSAAPHNRADFYAASAFGTRWIADLPLHHFSAFLPGDAAEPTISLRQVAALAARQAVAHRNRGAIMADGFRFAWENQVTFDFYAPDRIEYLPGLDWTGSLPDSFFSTVAALALAWNDRLALHASAVEWQGKAFLLAGKAGAGKSTLAAELLGHGATLIGDDLTVLNQMDGDSGFQVLPGRPTMRLHPDTATMMDKVSCCAVPEDPRGKLLVRPTAQCTNAATPLSGVLLLGGLSGLLSPHQALRLLPLHQFRPRWQQAIPGHGQRRAWLLEIAAQVPITGLAAVAGFDSCARTSRIEAVVAAMDRAVNRR